MALKSLNVILLPLLLIQTSAEMAFFTHFAYGLFQASIDNKWSRDDMGNYN